MYCLENTAVFITAVAPFTGARVETFNKATIFFNYFVAPFTGARVETLEVRLIVLLVTCRSLHGSAS